VGTTNCKWDPRRERIGRAKRLHEVVRQLRGRLLNSLAVIDVDVSRLPAAYFCQNDQRRDLAFSDVFMTPLRLEYKARLLERIVSKDYGWFLEDRRGSLFRDLETVRKLRNTLAHATVDVSDEALAKDPKEELGFVYYRNGRREVKHVTPLILRDLDVKVSMIVTRLIELGRVLGVNLER